MNKILKCSILVLAIFVSCIITACDNTKYELDIANSSLHLEVDESLEVEFTITKNGTVKVVSSDETVVSVNGSIITGLKAGECTLTLIVNEDETVKKEINVSVTKKTKSLSLMYTGESEYKGLQGTEIELQTIYDEGSEVILSWKVSSDSVTLVDLTETSKKVVLSKPGKAFVTVTDDVTKLSSTFTIEVVSGDEWFGLDVKKETVELYLGEEEEIEYSIENASVLFSSSDESVVSLEDGVIKAVGTGKAVVTVSVSTNPEVTKKINITVLERQNTTTLKIKGNSSVEIGKELELDCITDKNSDVDLIWSIDNNNLSISNNVLKGEKLGTTIVTVEDLKTGLKDSIEVTVYELTFEAIEAYLKNLYNEIVIEDDITVVSTYYDSGIKFRWQVFVDGILSETGKYTAPILTVENEILFEFTLDGKYEEVIMPITFKGTGTEIDVVIKKLDETIPTELRTSFTFPTVDAQYNGKMVWSTEGTDLKEGWFELIRNDGTNYTKVFKCTITVGEETRVKEYTIRCIMLPSMKKVENAIEYYNEYFDSMTIDSDIVLPVEDLDNDLTISWYSYAPQVLSSEGVYTKPFGNIEVDMMLFVKCGIYEKYTIINFKVKGEDYMSKWDKVEDFLERINKKEIKSQSFYLYGYEAGYESVWTENIGYLPFYLMDEVKTTVDILPDGSLLKPGRMRKSTNYITLHNTGMAHPTATAAGLNEYIHTTDREASWHFSIDDKEAFQELKLDEVGWHAGDGSVSYGDIYYNDTYKKWCIGGGNNNSVGIEMCVYAGCDFNMVMRNTAKVVSQLLVKYNLTPADVRQHNDFSGKNCPQVLRAADRWTEMLELISLEYFARTELDGVTFSWKSLSPEYMDDTGKVIKNPKTNPQISYEVTVTLDGETKTFNYKSVLK